MEKLYATIAGKNYYDYNVEMTNEEYREELKKMFDGVDNNALLQYFYILLPKLIKEWN